VATDRTTPGATLPAGARLAHFDPGAGVVSGAASPGLDDMDWLEIAIPGDVHRTLIDAGEIPDPFWDQQERDCAWMEGREWWYRIPLDVPPGDTLRDTERWQLVFHGLDTYVTISLDGEEIGA
jgi:beta-mannosidase